MRLRYVKFHGVFGRRRIAKGTHFSTLVKILSREIADTLVENVGADGAFVHNPEFGTCHLDLVKKMAGQFPENFPALLLADFDELSASFISLSLNRWQRIETVLSAVGQVS